jgi:hypothetical protein
VPMHQRVEYSPTVCWMRWATVQCGEQCEATCLKRSTSQHASQRSKTSQPPCSQHGHRDGHFDDWFAPHVYSQDTSLVPGVFRYARPVVVAAGKPHLVGSELCDRGFQLGCGTFLRDHPLYDPRARLCKHGDDVARRAHQPPGGKPQAPPKRKRACSKETSARTNCDFCWTLRGESTAAPPERPAPGWWAHLDDTWACKKCRRKVDDSCPRGSRPAQGVPPAILGVERPERKKMGVAERRGLIHRGGEVDRGEVDRGLYWRSYSIMYSIRRTRSETIFVIPLPMPSTPCGTLLSRKHAWKQGVDRVWT